MSWPPYSELVLEMRPYAWRMGVAISVLVSVFRSSPEGTALPLAVWYLFQFGPLLLVGLLTLTEPAGPLRRIDLALILFLGLFAFCALLSTATSRYRANTLEQTAILTFMFGFLTVTLWRRWSVERVINGDLSLVVALIAGVQGVGLAGFMTHRAWAVADYGRFQGLFDNANYAGVISALGIVLAVYLATRLAGRSRAVVAGAALLIAIALFLSGSRGGFFAAAAGLVTLALLRANRYVAIGASGIGALLAIGLVFAPWLPPSLAGPFSRTLQATDISSGRIQIYADLLNRWAHTPWLGTGYRSTELLTGAKHFTGHNVYLSVLAETGLLGAAVFAALLVFLFLSGPVSRGRRALLAAVVAVLAIELTESSLFGWGSPVTLPEWLTLCAFAALGRIEQLDGTERPLGFPTAAQLADRTVEANGAKPRRASPARGSESSEQRP